MRTSHSGRSRCIGRLIEVGLGELLCENWVWLFLLLLVLVHLFVTFLFVEGRLGVVNWHTLASLCIVGSDLLFIKVSVPRLSTLMGISEDPVRLLSSGYVLMLNLMDLTWIYVRFYHRSILLFSVYLARITKIIVVVNVYVASLCADSWRTILKVIIINFA